MVLCPLPGSLTIQFDVEWISFVKLSKISLAASNLFFTPKNELEFSSPSEECLARAKSSH